MFVATKGNIVIFVGRHGKKMQKRWMKSYPFSTTHDWASAARRRMETCCRRLGAQPEQHVTLARFPTTPQSHEHWFSVVSLRRRPPNSFCAFSSLGQWRPQTLIDTHLTQRVSCLQNLPPLPAQRTFEAFFLAHRRQRYHIFTFILLN